MIQETLQQDKNCQIFNTSRLVCQQCKENYYPSPTDYLCREVSQRTIGCSRYLTSKKCGACNDGFVFSGYQCLACATPNCKTCSLNPALCTECLDGFSGVSTNAANITCSTQCTALNCLTCPTNGTATCSTCRPGFRLNTTSNFCIACADAFCRNCTTSDGACVN